jgi:hypothetical protein
VWDTYRDALKAFEDQQQQETGRRRTGSQDAAAAPPPPPPRSAAAASMDALAELERQLEAKAAKAKAAAEDARGKDM